MNNGEYLTLYHGTSSFLARYLFSSYTESPLVHLGVHDLALTLYNQMIDLKGSEGGAWTLFENVPGLDNQFSGSEIVSGLRNAGQLHADQEGLITYGSFYASISFLLAAHYATKSPFGSELLHFLHGAMTALEYAGSNLPPPNTSVKQLFSAKYEPIVIVLQNVPLDILLREDGRGAYSKQNLSVYRQLVELAGESSVGAAGTVRINGPILEYVNFIRFIKVNVEYPWHTSEIVYEEITVNEFTKHFPAVDLPDKR